MWFRIIGAAIGSFITSLWSGWFHDRSVKKAEDEKVKSEQAERVVATAQQSKEIRDEVQAMPSAGPDSAAAELQRSFGRD